MPIIENYEIKNDSTFKIGGIVKQVAIPDSLEEFIALLNKDNYDYILGNCSNILFSSDKINKKIILTKKLTEFSINEKIVTVSCGTNGGLIAKKCAELGLSGFEFMIGFPGTFGGMIYMNASAHKQAISDCFISAKLYDVATKTIIELNKEEMGFDYRKSNLMSNNKILLSATFELNKKSREEIENRMKENLEFRKEKQPSLRIGNAGSIFKNPQGDAAGRLLELCNFKGATIGGAKVFEKHANFIVNENNASSKDVLELIHKMKNTVKENFNIELKPEVKYIGDRETEEYKLWELIL